MSGLEDSGPAPGSWAAGLGRVTVWEGTLLPSSSVSSHHLPHHPQPHHPPAWPSSHIKPSLCQAGGEPGAAGGGEEEVAPAREHLEAFRGGPAATRPGVGSSEEQPSPSPGRPPSPGPSFPATAPARPCHVKGGRRGVGAEGTLDRLGWAEGPCISGTRGRTHTRRTDTAAWMDRGTPSLRLPSV